MPPGPSRLNDGHGTLVIDASVLLNLLGTGRPAGVLAALNRRVLVESGTLRGEVKTDPVTRNSAKAVVAELFSQSALEEVCLSDQAMPTFMRLTGGPPPDDLEDGEAATIAHALDIGGVAVLDERKAIRIVRERWPDLPQLTTLDLLASPDIHAVFGSTVQAELVHTALMTARMRVSDPFFDWVVDLIGVEQARLCPSIPVRRLPSG
ncbi:MAG: hypothetical protein GVY13_09875 [Alphaproteobacteria bacterium]|jgi:hypothetical protein|nr:hypothetical protein [Alphaproteobacteria bacterium]